MNESEGNLLWAHIFVRGLASFVRVHTRGIHLFFLFCCCVL